MTTATERFRAARDFLLNNDTAYDVARRDFRWPELDEFNWALDWFDGVLAAERPEQPALVIAEDDGTQASYTFRDLSLRSDQVAVWLREHGVGRGSRVLLLLGNQVELWETTLAAMKLGAVIIPATTLLSGADLADRFERGHIAAVIARSELADRIDAVAGDQLRVAVGEPVQGWLRYADTVEVLERFTPDGPTKADDPLLLYFTSGTTAKPKLVEHTHVSYPVGHLTTMYWIGLRPGDVHVNISSPGWAKHAWSCVFAPWNAAATIAIVNYARFDAAKVLNALRTMEVTTFCAPPTVWRMLIQADLGDGELRAAGGVQRG